MARQPIVKDRELALTLGVIAYIAGAVLLWDAFEGRGKSRPFWPSKILGGLA